MPELGIFQIYLLAINVVTFAVFVVDKVKAMSGKWRVRESVLLGLSAIGGSVGGLLGMLVAHHKVNKPRFKFGLPIMLVVQVLIVLYLMNAGLV